MTEGYQGWANYETWCVSLWLNNEEPSYRYWREAAREAWHAADDDLDRAELFSSSEWARMQLAEQLKDAIEEANPLSDSASMWSDLLGAALSEVDWLEIANAFLEECDGYELLERPGTVAE